MILLYFVRPLAQEFSLCFVTCVQLLAGAASRSLLWQIVQSMSCSAPFKTKFVSRCKQQQIWSNVQFSTWSLGIETAWASLGLVGYSGMSAPLWNHTMLEIYSNHTW